MRSQEPGAQNAPSRLPSGRRLAVFALVVLVFLGVRLYFAWRNGKTFAEFLDELLESPRTERRAEPRDGARAEPAAESRISQGGKRASAKSSARIRFGWRDGETATGRGRVTKLLPDDLEPPRHQRFIVADDFGATLLVAHNIDLAPRLASLKVGDTVAFRGEYRDNDRGGVIHYTHADPSGRRAAGWLKIEAAEN